MMTLDELAHPANEGGERGGGGVSIACTTLATHVHVHVSHALSHICVDAYVHASGGSFAHNPKLHWKNLVAGGIAGAVSRTLVSPMERLKLLFQMQGNVRRCPSHALSAALSCAAVT